MTPLALSLALAVEQEITDRLDEADRLMLTLGCGRAPVRLGSIEPPASSRRVQAVSDLNVGVGYNTQTGQYFAFSDFEAAMQSPEASTSFLVALDGYEVSGATESVSGRIDVQVRNPGGWQLPVTAGVDFSGPYDWPAELASANRDIAPGLFEQIAASASALAVFPNESPRDAISAITASWTRTTGAAWGDVRLMLAAIAAWFRVQPDTFWTGGGGGSSTASGSIETVWPQQLLAVSVDLGSLTATPVTEWSTWSDVATTSLLVKLESVDFPMGSNVPIAVRVDIKRPGPGGFVEVVSHDLARLVGTNWRDLLTAQTPVLTDTEVQQQRNFFMGWSDIDPWTPVATVLDAMLSSSPQVEARDELARILTISGFLGRGLPPQELAPDTPLLPAEQRPAGVFGIALEVASGRRIPITSESSRSQYASSPAYIVATLDAVELTSDGYATAFRVLVSGSDGTASIKFPLPAPRIWADPATFPALSDAEWQDLLSGNYEVQPGSAYRVQVSGAVVLMFAAVIAALVYALWLFNQKVLPLLKKLRPTRDPRKSPEEIDRDFLITPPPDPTPSTSPSPSPSPTPDWSQKHQLWVTRDFTTKGTGNIWPGRQCVSNFNWLPGTKYVTTPSTDYVDADADYGKVFNMALMDPSGNVERYWFSTINFTSWETITTDAPCP